VAFSLAAVTVTAPRISGAVAAVPRRKPATRPRRAPRRAPRKKPTPRRTPPRRAPSKAPVKIPLKKVGKALFKRSPVGRVLDVAELYGNAMYNLTQRMLGGPIKPVPQAPTPGLPFVVGVDKYAQPNSIQSVATLEPVTVKASPTARVKSPFEDWYERNTTPGYRQRYRTKPKPRSKPTQQPRRTPSRRARPRPTLTRKEREALGLGKLEALQPSPTPKEELERDPCKEKRRRNRSKCPERGYRMQCIEWRKVKCQ
jgi:hypothetical protein